MCVLRSDGQVGRHPIEVVKRAMLEGEGERKTSLLLNLTFILGSVLYLTAQGHYAQI